MLNNKCYLKNFSRAILAANVSTVAMSAVAAATNTNEVFDLDTEFSEIVITARKRVETLSDVPIAVTAFTEAKIKRTGIERPEDFVQLTPNVAMTNTLQAGDSQVNIRGVVSSRDAEASFALLVDGVLVTNPLGFNRELVDVEQIEVLKGPQGALYGRNAISGAVLITTKKPNNKFEGHFQGQVGNNGTRKVSGVLSGALVTDKLYGRVSMSDRHTNGQFKNEFLGKDDVVDFYNDQSIRGRLIWEAKDSVTLDFRAGITRVDAGAINYNATFGLPELTALTGNPNFNEDINDHEFIYNFNVKPVDKQKGTELSVKLDTVRQNFDVTAVLAYNKLDETVLTDGTGAAFGGYSGEPSCIATLNTLDTRLLPDPFTPAMLPPYSPTTCDGYQYHERNQTDTSVEVRFSSNQERRLHWIAGAYYADIEREAVVAYGADLGRGFLLQPYVPPEGPNPTDLLFDDINHIKVAAVFGELSYDIRPEMEVSLALRYDRENRRVENRVPSVTAPLLNGGGAPINPAFAVVASIEDRERTFAHWQPKLSWRWNVIKPLDVYASWGVGFRSGGFNSIGTEAVIEQNYNAPPTNAGLSIPESFDKDISKTTEIGFKSRWREGKVTVNGALFHTDATNNQMHEFLAGPFGLLRTVTEIDKVTYRGAELDFEVYATTCWSVHGGFGYVDSEIKKNDHRPISVGNKIPYSPRYTLNLGTRYNTAIGDHLRLIAGLDWRRTGETWFHVINDESVPSVFGFDFDGTSAQRDAFDVFNTRVSLEAENWQVSAWSKNLLDKRYVAEAVPAPEFGGSFVHPAPGRTYGIDLTYHF